MIRRFFEIRQEKGTWAAIRRLMLYVRWSISKILPLHIIDPYIRSQRIELQGPRGSISLIVDRKDRIVTRKAENCEPYEPGLVSLLDKAVEEDSVVYDVGSRFGYYPKILNMMGLTTKQIHAFEMDKISFGYLRRNCRDIAVLNRVRIGNQNSDLTLDEYSKNTFQPDIVKIDVEGDEINVINGMTHLLKTGIELFVEYHPHKIEPTESQKLINILDTLDYQYSFLDHRTPGKVFDTTEFPPVDRTFLIHARPVGK